MSEAIGTKLWREYGQQIKVEFPSPKTGNQWQLINQGYVGYIPLTDSHHFRLEPRFPIQSLFGMLEYAFNLKSFRFLDGLMTSHDLPEFYERLALKLANGILNRARQGLYRAYLSQQANLTTLRGRLDMTQLSRQIGKITLPCHYNEQTADLPDNQILLWTLHQILRQRMSQNPTITRAYRALSGTVTLMPHTATDCIGRNYSRLNEDYRPLHALCRFFLASSGPHVAEGAHTMLPFLVDMSLLYEQFVAAWLQEHLPSQWQLKGQERIKLHQTHFKIDLVLSDRNTGQTLAVLDTKYKAGVKHDDIFQITTYATAKHCAKAVLIYPQTMSLSQQPIGREVQIHYLTFDLNQPLAQSGEQFWQSLESAIF
jgi:5-methylcytosine-specific restriction enzyme subunit McrC